MTQVEHMVVVPSFFSHEIRTQHFFFRRGNSVFVILASYCFNGNFNTGQTFWFHIVYLKHLYALVERCVLV